MTRSRSGGGRRRRAGSRPSRRSIRLTVPEAGTPRSSTTMSSSWLLAVRSPGSGSRPPQLLTTRVARPRRASARTGGSGPGIRLTRMLRREVDLDHGVPVGRGDEQAAAVAGDRHPAGHGVGLRALGLERDPGPRAEPAGLEEELLDVPRRRCWRRAACRRATRRARGTRRRRRAEIESARRGPHWPCRGRRPACSGRRRTSPDGWSARSIGRPSKASEPALDPLARGDQEAAVGLPAHPDRGPAGQAEGRARRARTAAASDRSPPHRLGLPRSPLCGEGSVGLLSGHPEWRRGRRHATPPDAERGGGT